MSRINPTRLVMGVIVLLGVSLWPPVAYVAGAMMVLAGLTGVCPLEMLFNRLLGVRTSCTRPPA